MKKFLKCFLFFFLSLVFLEYVYKVAAFHILFDRGLIYMVLFSALYAWFMTIIALFLPKKLSFPTTVIIMFITTIIFIAEYMFMHIYNLTFSIYSITMADQALDFTDIIFRVMKEEWLVILLMFIPFISYIFVHKKILIQKKMEYIYKYLGILLGAYLLVLLSLNINKDQDYSPYNLYFEVHAPSTMVNTLGLATEFRLDITRFLFGFDPKIEIDGDVDMEPDKGEPIVSETKYNKLDLNFDFDSNSSSINSINAFFKSQDATNQNEYTGIFKGKNIIYILAEGFNSLAVDKDITPTLYKLTNSSFVFENYYSPVFMSTTGGEFQFSTGLIPTQESLNKWKSGNIFFPYTIGNVFKNSGYETIAYHNWTYTYYKRHVTMPNLGFDTFKACGNGLQKEMNCKLWPPSDIDMMKATVGEYYNKDKFAVHYITVSGHAEYNFFGNNMAMKNKQFVKDLPYSTSIKAYLATQIELDRALEYMMKELENANKLDDTVIVLSGDHYPYTLSVDEINEKSEFPRDELFEVNRSNLIIYNSEIEKPVIVDKLASSIDVIPTIMNMFGYEYDSRIMIGSDIMSDHESVVVFSDNSWISEKGRYNARLKKFIPNDEEVVEDDYIAKINRNVQNRVNVSTQILRTNYYKALFDNQINK